MGSRQRHHMLWQGAAIGVAVAATLPALAVRATAVSDELPEPLAGRPFAPVFEGVVPGDLLLAGNSNLISAGGWRDESGTAADVDGDASRICVNRRADDGGIFATARPICADNSSSAQLDLPAGARVLAARLYIETSVGRDLGPLHVRLDGPGEGFDYQTLAATPAPASARAPSKLYEAAGDAGDGAVLRQAVWDVTAQVAAAGPGAYTVADIVNQRAGPWLPLASWAIVAAYELDPAVGLDGITPVDRHRFASRFLSWHDGFQYLETGSLSVAIGDLPPGTAFGKSLHIVADGRGGRSDNLLFAGGPLGNNNTPGNAPPPPGVQLGTDAVCNLVTDVQNDSICVLGTSVSTKAPGAADFVSSGDGKTPSSGSAVDMDVIRIPDRYFRSAGPDVAMQVQVAGADSLAPGMLAVSIDVPGDGR